MVQMMERPIFFEVVLCGYRGNGCASRGPAVLVRSALMRRIFCRNGMWMRAVLREKIHENPSEKYRRFHHLHHMSTENRNKLKFAELIVWCK